MLSGSNKRFLLATLCFAVYFAPVYSQLSNFFISHGNNLSSVDCNGILFAPITNQYHQALGAGAVWLRNQSGASGVYIWLVNDIDFKGNHIE
jgi:hypothetical protein